MLKFIIDKLEDVAEGLRDYYKEKDGKFILQVDGAKTQADIDRQLQANQAERTAHSETKRKLTEAQQKLAAFGELDPDEVQAQLQELETLRAAGPNAKAEEIQRKAEEIATQKIKVETQKLQRDLAKVTTERDEALQESTTLKTNISQRTIDDAVRAAATSAKVIPEAVADVLILARNDFKLMDGNKVVTEDGRDPAQWLEDSKKARPYLWPQSRGAGGGGGDGPGAVTAKDNPFSHEGWNLTKQGELLRSNPTKAAEMAQLAGTKVGGMRPAKPA